MNWWKEGWYFPGNAFEDWFDFPAAPPEHLTGGELPDDPISSDDPSPPSDSPTVPASESEVLYRRMEQFTNGWDWDNWTPNNVEEARGAWQLWLVYGVPGILPESARQVIVDQQRHDDFLERQRQRALPKASWKVRPAKKFAG